MDISLFLAKVIGLYLVIMSVLILLNPENLKKRAQAIIDDMGTLFVVAFITLILGILLVVSHNVWVWDWPVIITVLAWLTLISGIARLFFPHYIVKMGKKMLALQYYFTISGIVTLLIGVFLLVKGCGY